MAGSADLIRIGTGAVGDDDLNCPSFTGVKVRPQIRPRTRVNSLRPRLETFALDPVMTALNRFELDHWDLDKALAEIGTAGKPCHPGTVTFARHAVRSYLDAAASTATVLTPVRDWWVVQKAQTRTWELYAWGRRYQSADGRHRELRLLRFGDASSRPRDLTQVAIAAFSAAFGAPAPWPDPWSTRFQTGAHQNIDHVRIVDVGLLDGSEVVRFDGTPADAETFFASHGRTQIQRIAEGGPAHPGSSCPECKQLTSCTTLPRIPGVLGLPAKRAPQRVVSASDLRYYRTCPAQAHLRSVHLPRDGEYSDEAVLGQAVHAWLENLHTSGAPCDRDAMPTGDEPWSAGRWTVSGEHARIGAQMLRHHPDVCALRHNDTVTEVRIEPRLTVHDTAAHAVVIAKPDMLYLDDGAWVWREVKTTQKRRWFHTDLLDEFPQLALAVSFLAEGVLGGDTTSSRIELEVLRPTGPDIDWIDPTDPERVAKARTVLRELAQPWRDDETFDARPGRNCRWCPVSRWCPSFPGPGPSSEGDDL
ncbi:PD-(D/E)XK nuclease family protein [Amycolatopsis sp. PS_44_ISF1]|uniref:PD-(D/E)XK nuclease family protein n=1 Tax=Amycolatopsis sp. PS_44_ISF1 TaxID=2974917 RepID=UPI0028DD5BE7|nr:PD-(D/E)XK nuclease family protein [Amycolatopsis sp. PS_44_ISF1]MDT8916076.1 PD-(D/E)XK nuclease family protein [Amycolatopsis sp. PS_44_ISF1]